MVYLPIFVLVMGIGVLLVVSVVYGIRKKDILLPLAAAAVPILPAMMIFVEGKESYYRACQYVPLVGAFGVLLLFWDKELLGVLEGDKSLEEAAEEVKLRSRQYAKRQLTWLRRNPALHWIFWEKERDFARALQISTEILASAGVC